jgi:hypothetical protein
MESLYVYKDPFIDNNIFSSGIFSITGSASAIQEFLNQKSTKKMDYEVMSRVISIDPQWPGWLHAFTTDLVFNNVYLDIVSLM